MKPPNDIELTALQQRMFKTIYNDDYEMCSPHLFTDKECAHILHLNDKFYADPKYSDYFAVPDDFIGTCVACPTKWQLVSTIDKLIKRNIKIEGFRHQVEPIEVFYIHHKTI